MKKRLLSFLPNVPIDLIQILSLSLSLSHSLSLSLSLSLYIYNAFKQLLDLLYTLFLFLSLSLYIERESSVYILYTYIYIYIYKERERERERERVYRRSSNCLHKSITVHNQQIRELRTRMLQVSVHMGTCANNIFQKYYIFPFTRLRKYLPVWICIYLIVQYTLLGE